MHAQIVHHGGCQDVIRIAVLWELLGLLLLFDRPLVSLCDDLLQIRSTHDFVFAVQICQEGRVHFCAVFVGDWRGRADVRQFVALFVQRCERWSVKKKRYVTIQIEVDDLRQDRERRIVQNSPPDRI